MRIYKPCARCGNISLMEMHHTLCDDCADEVRTAGRNYAEQRRKSLLIYTPDVSFILTIRPLRYIYLPHTWKLSQN